MTLLDEWKEKQPPELAKAPKRWSRTSNHFETFCPEDPALRIMALVVYIPVAACFRTAGSGLSRVHRTAVLRRPALDGLPWLCYFPASGGGISSEPPLPMIGKGRGLG